MSDLPLHKIHDTLPPGVDTFDVFIAGSGPIGATYARLLVDQGYHVCMVETGDQGTRIPAAHKKNEIEYKKDIDRFVRVIQGALSIASVPSSTANMVLSDPSSWRAEDPNAPINAMGSNPRQKVHNNLPGEAVTRCVGGMSTHWTCSTPEFLAGLERPKFCDDEKTDSAEWKALYECARRMIGTSDTQFDQSIRHNVVLKALQAAYPDRGVKPLPLACHTTEDDIEWHAADNIYGDMFTNPNKMNGDGTRRGVFKLLPNTLCTKLHLAGQTLPTDPDPEQIYVAEVRDLKAMLQHQKSSDFHIRAKIFVLAAGAIGTPQILANSGFGGTRETDKPQLIPRLGFGITEQPMTFCQVVLRQNLVRKFLIASSQCANDSVKVEDIANLSDKPDWWKEAVTKHKKDHPNDSLPIPFMDKEPQVTIPVSAERPWHVQVHRDAFSYGEVGPLVDARVVVDLRFFGMQKSVPENRIIFETDVRDAYGMPQPTFEYQPTQEHAAEATRMMNDMTDVANKLGGYLPGAGPQFMAPGLALHLGGSIRVGNDPNTTVANYHSQVWGFNNLYVAGNGLIPTPFAANPTLTSMCFAIRAAQKIHTQLSKTPRTMPPAPEHKMERTPESWFKWAKDRSDPNFPKHEKEPYEVISF
ncbi:GMC oxidoreductase [Mycena indigotica]|uniref:Pyranose 2-oxidase n=1 Tax=Mycena indigotica TaxID=2126181 RepID=A0A8H6S3I9_9AGAR|nr:GMC oxidoreductase [Mycena indigotica]KAF7292249.1 GMC oxidoreductase [Mycena indigotica]